jgi:Zn-dependent M28 family amino/carboxypeptidase
MIADLNTDMFLPLYPFHVATVYGLHESDLGDTVRKVAQSLDVEVQDDPAPQRNVFIRSDQYSFIRAGVPSLMMDVGYKKGSKEEEVAKEWLKNRYHAPSDDLNQPVDLQAAGQYNRLILTLAESVANEPSRPQWKPDSFFRRFAQ